MTRLVNIPAQPRPASAVDPGLAEAGRLSTGPGQSGGVAPGQPIGVDPGPRPTGRHNAGDRGQPPGGVDPGLAVNHCSVVRRPASIRGGNLKGPAVDPPRRRAARPLAWCACLVAGLVRPAWCARLVRPA